MKRTLVAGALILALVAGIMAIGLASAQTGTPEPSATDEPERLADRFKEELAGQLGISVEELNSALDSTQFALIDEAVADGKLTEDEAEKLRERVEEGHNLFPYHRFHHGPGPGLRLKMGLIEATAEVLGVEASVVTEGLRNGDTLAEIANANGMETEAYKAALLANIRSKLDEKVADGDLTQEEADNLYERLSNNIDDIINQEPPDTPPFPGFRFKMGLVEATAEVLGVDVSVVTEGLRNGDTLAEIANANGMETEAYKAALLTNIKSKLDEKVADGDLTQEEADNLYERLSNNIDDIVNHEPPDFRPRPGADFERPHFLPGPDIEFGFGPDAEGDESENSADEPLTIF